MEGTSIPPSPAEGAATTSPATMTTPDLNALKRKRQPRNSACQSCAALKMKVPPTVAVLSMSSMGEVGLLIAVAVYFHPQWQMRKVSLQAAGPPAPVVIELCPGASAGHCVDNRTSCCAPARVACITVRLYHCSYTNSASYHLSRPRPPLLRYLLDSILPPHIASARNHDLQ